MSLELLISPGVYLFVMSQYCDYNCTSSVPAPALMREQADIKAAIMVGSTFSSMLGTNNSANLLPISGLPPLQVAAVKIINLKGLSRLSLQLGKEKVALTMVILV